MPILHIQSERQNLELLRFLAFVAIKSMLTLEFVLALSFLLTVTVNAQSGV